MSACKLCEKKLGGSNWEQTRVIKREVHPGEYFQTPNRVWHMRAGAVEAFVVDGAMFCKACYETKVAPTA